MLKNYTIIVDSQLISFLSCQNSIKPHETQKKKSHENPKNRKKAIVLPKTSKPPDAEWSQERVEGFPMLASALTRSNNNGEIHEFELLPMK